MSGFSVMLIGAIIAAALLGVAIWAFNSKPSAPPVDLAPETSPQNAVTGLTTQAEAQDEDAPAALTGADKQSLLALREELTLPAAGLEVLETPPTGPLDSRIGGAVALPSHMEWPKDKKGAPLIFFAQVNFEGMPTVEGYPETGILYFFHGADDLYGADFEAPREKGDYAVLWWDAPDASKLRTPVLQDLEPEHYTPMTIETQRQGRQMRWASDSAQMPPTFSDFRIYKHVDGWWKREGGEAFMDSLHDEDWDVVPNTYVGGHPRFTQWDLRAYGQNQELTRVLFQAGSNQHFMWGDVGEAVFMISEEDLAARRFERAVFWWDCH